MADAKKAWGGRFEGSLDEFVTRFGASLPVDRVMWESDIRGSIAHVRMLAAQGIVPADDAEAIEAGLLDVREDLAAGRFVVRQRRRGHPHGHRARPDRHASAPWAASCTPRARATTRSRPTRACTSRASLGTSSTVWRRCRRPCSPAPTSTSARSCPATRTCRRRSRSCSATTCWRTSGCSSATSPGSAARDAADVSPLGAAALAGTTFPIDRRTVADELGFGGHAELAGRGLGPGLPARPHLRVRGGDDAPLAPVRGARPVVERRVRVRHDGRRVLHRLVDHAAEEEPGRRRARARQDRPGLRRPHGSAHGDEGPAARVQQGHAGGQGGRLRRRRHPRRLPARRRRHGSAAMR